jgi:hypothetical protein
MFPTALRMDGIDLALRAVGWLPSLAPAAARRRATDL